jgi:SecDF, P1 head subdomain
MRRLRLIDLLDCLPIILYFVRVMRFCDGTMRICPGHINLKKINAVSCVAAAAALALLCGCQTDKNKKLVSALRVHIQVTVPTASSQTVTVLRSSPVQITVAKDPVITEANLLGARVINTPGGFAVQLQFDDTGMWMLQQYSASNPGRHFAIYGQWGEKLADGRWLAAPLITRRISDGSLTFTPDLSRDEVNQLAIGLNNVVKKIHKGESKIFR